MSGGTYMTFFALPIIFVLAGLFAGRALIYFAGLAMIMWFSAATYFWTLKGVEGSFTDILGWFSLAAAMCCFVLMFHRAGLKSKAPTIDEEIAKEHLKEARATTLAREKEEKRPRTYQEERDDWARERGEPTRAERLEARDEKVRRRAERRGQYPHPQG